jgi:hypothetical protein
MLLAYFVVPFYALQGQFNQFSICAFVDCFFTPNPPRGPYYSWHFYALQGQFISAQWQRLGL